MVTDVVSHGVIFRETLMTFINIHDWNIYISSEQNCPFGDLLAVGIQRGHTDPKNFISAIVSSVSSLPAVA